MSNGESPPDNGESPSDKLDQASLILGPIFLAIGVLSWLLTIQDWRELTSVEKQFAEVIAILFIAIGVSGVCVARYGATALIDINSTWLGGTTIRVGNFTAVCVLVGGLLYLGTAGIRAEHSLEPQVNELESAIEQLKVKNKNEAEQLKAENEQLRLYQDFFDWVMNDELDNTGLRVSTSLWKWTGWGPTQPIESAVYDEDGLRADDFRLSAQPLNLTLRPLHDPTKIHTQLTVRVGDGMRLKIEYTISEAELCSLYIQQVSDFYPLVAKSNQIRDEGKVQIEALGSPPPTWIPNTPSAEPGPVPGERD
jgi:hypothetical protein